MQNTHRRGTVYSNQNSPAKAGSNSGAGCQNLGCAAANPAPLGVRPAHPARLCSEDAPTNTGRRPVGGQASLGTFGLPSVTGRPRHTAASPAQGQAPSPVATSPKGDDTARKVGGLTYGQRQARVQAWTTFGATCPVSPVRAKVAAAAPDIIKVAVRGPVRVPLSRESLDLFARLASIEARPLDDLLTELLTNAAAHLSRTRPALHLDEADRIALARYVESVERDDEERAARAKTTPYMLATAAASDMREADPAYHDNEANELAHRSLGAGYVELALAMEA